MRGLHYDIEKGLLLKLDSFLQIQFGSVYRGLTPLSTEEVLSLYKNRIIPIAYVEGHSKSERVILFNAFEKYFNDETNFFLHTIIFSGCPLKNGSFS